MINTDNLGRLFYFIVTIYTHECPFKFKLFKHPFNICCYLIKVLWLYLKVKSMINNSNVSYETDTHFFFINKTFSNYVMSLNLYVHFIK